MKHLVTGAVRSILLAWITASCMAWGPSHPTTVPGPEFPSGHVRVRLLGGSVIVVREARIVGDSIVGVHEPPLNGRVAIAASDVASVEQRQFSPLRTAGLAVAIGFAALISFVVVVLILLSQDES